MSLTNCAKTHEDKEEVMVVAIWWKSTTRECVTMIKNLCNLSLHHHHQFASFFTSSTIFHFKLMNYWVAWNTSLVYFFQFVDIFLYSKWGIFNVVKCPLSFEISKSSNSSHILSYISLTQNLNGNTQSSTWNHQIFNEIL